MLVIIIEYVNYLKILSIRPLCIFCRHIFGRDGEGSPKQASNSGSPARKKQPCSDIHHHGFNAFNRTLSTLSEKSSVESPEIYYSPCPLGVTQSLAALRQRMTDTFPLLAQGISLDNPLYFALNQTPTPSPVDLINKEIPTTKKKDASETPTRTREFMLNFAKNLNLGLNESDESKLSPRRSPIPTNCRYSFKDKLKTSEVSPLARRLAWLRLNTSEKNGLQDDKLEDIDNIISFPFSDRIQGSTLVNDNYLETKTFLDKDTSLSGASTLYDKQFSRHRSKNSDCDIRLNRLKSCDEQRWSSERGQRVGNILLESSVINILNTNHDRQKDNSIFESSLVSCSNLRNSTTNESDMETESAAPNMNSKGDFTKALKRRGVIFNEQTFMLNTPPASDSDDKQTKSSNCTSIDLNEPSTLKRQKAIRRRLRSVSDNNLPLSKRFGKKHPISYLTLPSGVPSPFDINTTETPKNTRSKSVSNLRPSSSRKVTFGSLYDIEYSDSGENNSTSFMGLTLPEGIPSPPSPAEEEIPGVRPLVSPKAHPTGNKRKSEATIVSESSEETWDSHRLHFLKTPRLADTAFEDASFADSSRTKSPSSSKNNDDYENDDDFSSIGELTW